MLTENLQRVLSAVRLELEQTRSSQDRLLELEALLQAELDDMWASGVTPEQPADEPVAEPEPEPEPVDYEELRRAATHAALTLLRAGEKEKVAWALQEVHGTRVSELPDEALQTFVSLLEG